MGASPGGAERVPDGTRLRTRALRYSQAVLPALTVALIAAAMGIGVLLEVRGDHMGRRLVAATVILVLAGATAYLLVEAEPAPDATGASAVPTDTPNGSAAAAPSHDESPAASVEPIIVRYEVSLGAGAYTLFPVDADGRLGTGRRVSFDGASRAPVDRVEASNGLVHWRTVVGSLAGLSYVPDRSGSFQIRAVLRWPDGHTDARIVDPET